MSKTTYVCPVCLLSEAGSFPAEEGSEISCPRCGDFVIAADAEEDLLQSTAPIPTGYEVSHAFRNAARDHGEIIIDRENARRLIQRRHQKSSDKSKDRLLLFWLERQSNKTKAKTLTMEGWTAVLNEKNPSKTSDRIARFERKGLITIDRDSADQITIELTEKSRQILVHSAEQDRMRRRRKREIDALAEKRSDGNFYVSKLYLSQYKCFRDEQQVSFATEDDKIARWTFLIGENGVGKTSVLQAIAQLFPKWDRGRRNNPVTAVQDRRSDYSEIRRDLMRESRIEAEYHQGRLGEYLCDPLISGAADEATEMDNFDISLRLAADSITMMWSGKFTYIANYSRMPRAPMVVGYGASRAVGRAGLSHEKEPNDSTDSLFFPERPLQDPEDWLLRNDYASRFESPSRNLSQAGFEKLQRALLEILPDVVQISIMPPSENRDRPWVGFKTSKGLLDYRSLSVGYQSTLAWIVDLAIRMIENYPDADDPLEMPAVVLIDEIDIHLHPSWQRSITKNLEDLFPATQFIATTHSPLIIQGAVEANLVLLRNDGDKVVVLNDVDEIRNFRVDQILTSELFGLSSARPDDLAALMKRRIELLAQEDYDESSGELADLEKRLDSWRTTQSKPLSSKAKSYLDQLKN